MKEISFYESLNENKMSREEGIIAQRSYTYNYFNLLPQSYDAQIVDLGCSVGHSLGWLLANGYQEIVGVDSDPVAIEIAKNTFDSKLNNDKIVCMEALSYLKECGDNSVDMFLMFNVIEHIHHDMILEIMEEIRRILQVDGYFLAQTGNWENPFNIGLFTRDFTHKVMYTKNSLRQLMKMAGFSEDNIQLHPIRYKRTLRNLPLQISEPFTSWFVRMVALCMRMRINETSPLIYCLVKK